MQGSDQGIMEKKMETTIVYWVYIGIMEKKMETTVVYFVYIGIMEKKQITDRSYSARRPACLQGGQENSMSRLHLDQSASIASGPLSYAGPLCYACLRRRVRGACLLLEAGKPNRAGGRSRARRPDELGCHRWCAGAQAV